MRKKPKKFRRNWQWWVFGSVFFSTSAAWAALLASSKGPFVTKFLLMILWAGLTLPIERVTYRRPKGFSILVAVQWLIPATAGFFLVLAEIYGWPELVRSMPQAISEPEWRTGETAQLLWTCLGAELVFWLAWPSD